MAGWGRIAAVVRNVLRSPRSLRGLALCRAVGPGVLGSIIGTGAVCYYQYHANNGTLPFAVHAEQQKEAAAPQRSGVTDRFSQFASVVYEQEPYMTPRDFLFSVMLENVDRKLQKKILTTEELNRMLASASKAKAGSDLFRTIGDNGLISYTEYLFLLTVLTKPRTGFRIAFQMLDLDCNEHVENKEFLKLLKMRKKKKSRKGKRTVLIEDSAEEREGVNTTLQAHFFGKKGENKLQYQEFHRFMQDLQAEVQEMEFLQFSRGMDTMRREDFAEWLLHYTNKEDNEVYWENMKKIPAGQSIKFDEFKAFCHFTNNMEDFAISLKMVTQANRPIGIAQFKRAVKIATGNDLSENVLDTVFKVFDRDGDDCLSHKEFIGVMEDRVLRGLKVRRSSFSGFWKCVKRKTMKGTKEADTGFPF